MSVTLETPPYVLLEHYAMQCAAERQKKKYPITDMGLSSYSRQIAKVAGRD